MTADLFLLNAFALAIGLAAGGKRIRSERTASSNLPFSDAVWHGNTLYLCGHIGLDPKTRPATCHGRRRSAVGDGQREAHAGIRRADHGRSPVGPDLLLGRFSF